MNNSEIKLNISISKKDISQEATMAMGEFIKGIHSIYGSLNSVHQEFLKYLRSNYENEIVKSRQTGFTAQLNNLMIAPIKNRKSLRDQKFRPKMVTHFEMMKEPLMRIT